MVSSTASEFLANFYVWGITYAQAELDLRSRFSLSESAMGDCLQAAKSTGAKAAFGLSTCNRTEFYGYGEGRDTVLKEWLKASGESEKSWRQIGWLKTGSEAVAHLFRVCCGLDSQILGDIQIMGQVKAAYTLAKEVEMGHPYLERLLNTCIEAHKSVKNQTSLGRGAASVSNVAAQAAVRWHRQQEIRQILLVGAGDIGKATLAHLRKQFPQAHIHISNRSAIKARELADRFAGSAIEWKDWEQLIPQADLIVAATAAPLHILTPDNLIRDHKARLLIDLGVPLNIDPSLSQRPEISLLNTDELSATVADTHARRQADVPLAEAVIQPHTEQFASWMKKRQVAPWLGKIQEHAQHAQNALLKENQPGPALDSKALETSSSLLARRFTRMAAQKLHAQATVHPQQLQLLQAVLER